MVFLPNIITPTNSEIMEGGIISIAHLLFPMSRVILPYNLVLDSREDRTLLKTIPHARQRPKVALLVASWNCTTPEVGYLAIC